MSETTSKLPQVVAKLVNDHGQTYFAKIAVDEPVPFVRALWHALSEYESEMSDEFFEGELTDRGKAVRITSERSAAWGGWIVFVRTHAWSPSGDRAELHSDVLRFLRSRELDV